MKQIELHNQIDSLLKQAPGSVSVERVKEIILVNVDAKNYFYSKADEAWIDWLFQNDFLKEINDKPKDTTRYFYQMPELGYLTRMAERVPEKVVDIILCTSNSASSFNPEVVDRFAYILSLIPAEQIARLVVKVRDENWIRLMAGFNHSGFEYGKTLEKLAKAKDYDSLIVLAEVILSVRIQEEIKITDNGITTNNPFYLNELSYTKVFEYLLNVDERHYESTLRLAVKKMIEVVLLGDKSEDGSIFPIEEMFYLFDVDFFTLQPGQSEHLSSRDDVRELAALIKVSSQRLIGERCGEADEVRRIYKSYIEQLPNSRSMYRLRLFVFSLCPTIFFPEIKSALFAIFKYEKPWDLVSGAEYERLIQSGLPTLPEPDQREFIALLVKSFNRDDRYKSVGRDLLSAAYKVLTEAERAGAEQVFGPLAPDYKPEPSVGRMVSGFVTPQAPGGSDEWKQSLEAIVAKLKTDWAPEALAEQDRGGDFLKPIDADGAGERIISELGSRTQEFLAGAENFFDRASLDSHYTNAYLRGVYDMLRENRMPAGSDLTGVLGLMNAIRESGISEPFDNGKSKTNARGWVASWDSVHKAIGDITKQLLVGETDKLFINFAESRQVLFEIIKYLLQHNDPNIQDERAETAKIKRRVAGADEYEASDPYTTAINSVRGRAFEALVAFLFHDGKLLEQQGEKISPDVKGVYETVLAREQTQALMFLFGHYIPSFYYRDIGWVHGLLPTIFSTNPAKKDLYLAAWEGYLSNNLYKEIFKDEEFQKLYQRAINLSSTEYTKRRYFRKLDEGLATHLALAFMHYEEFGFSNPLFVAFWDKVEGDRHAEFIGFIGRAYVSGEVKGATELLKEGGMAKNRLLELWDWALERCSEPDAFARFGFWLKLDKRLFDFVWLADHVKRTLQKTSGDIDWDYGLMTSIVELAKAAPGDTLEILRLMILENGIRGEKASRSMLYMHDEWLQAFEVLYANEGAKSTTYDLINELIIEGGSAYWKLKDVIKE